MNTKTTIGIGTVAVLAAGGLMFSATETPAEARASVETSATSIIQTIDDAQPQNLSRDNRYKQYSRSVYQTDSGRDYSVSVHEYVGPRGKGYIINMRTVIGTDEYLKTIDKGPEGRSSDWQKVIKIEK